DDPTVRNVLASFASCIATSEVPPRPTPTIIGGHGRAPDSKMHCSTNFWIPLRPSDGFSILRKLIFSEPDPFGAMWISMLSEPGTKSNLMIGMPWPVLVPVCLRVTGCTEFERNGYSAVARSQA